MSMKKPSFFNAILPSFPSQYSWKTDLLNDIIAGISVAAMMVPQSISFITLSKLPMNYGLHATLIAAFSYSIFGGRSFHMSLGPFAVSAYIMYPAVAGVLGLKDESEAKDNPAYNNMMMLMLFMTGCLLVLLGITRVGAFMGKILHPSFISGFTTATAVLIITSQLEDLVFGRDYEKKELFVVSDDNATLKFLVDLGSSYQKIAKLFRDYYKIHGPSIALSISTLVFMKLLQYGPKLIKYFFGNKEEEGEEGKDDGEKGSGSELNDLESGGRKINGRASRRMSVMSSIGGVFRRPRSFSLPAAFNSDWRFEGDVPTLGEAFEEEEEDNNGVGNDDDDDDDDIFNASSFSGRRQSYWTNGGGTTAYNDQSSTTRRFSMMSSAISEIVPEEDEEEDFTTITEAYRLNHISGYEGEESNPNNNNNNNNNNPYNNNNNNNNTNNPYNNPYNPYNNPKNDNIYASSYRPSLFPSNNDNSTKLELGEFSRIKDNFNTIGASTIAHNPDLLQRINHKQWQELHNSTRKKLDEKRKSHPHADSDKDQRPGTKFQIPDILLTLIIFTSISVWVGFEGKGVSVLGEIKSGLPSPSVEFLRGKELDDVGKVFSLILSSIMLAILTFVLSISVGLAYSKEGYGYEIQPTREAIAIGLANIASSMFQGFLCAGGLSRAAVLKASGAKSHIVTWVSCLIVMFTLLWLTGLFYHVPKPVLAMIVCLAMTSSLKNLAKLKTLYQSTCTLEYQQETEKLQEACKKGQRRRKPVKLVLMQTSIATWPKSIFGERFSFILFVITFMALTIFPMQYGVAVCILLCGLEYAYVRFAKHVSRKRARKHRRQSIADFVKKSAEYVREFSFIKDMKDDMKDMKDMKDDMNDMKDDMKDKKDVMNDMNDKKDDMKDMKDVMNDKKNDKKNATKDETKDEKFEVEMNILSSVKEE